MDNILVGAIVFLAVLYLCRRIAGSAKGKGSGCCCGCDACGKKPPNSVYSKEL
ncbi:MAG: FeoB-associated Cys-rich membrane protein [Deltaproteobacteria bacterium]|nr:FeoB-associated Cys-rich membrane protein [Deltaproteobacteria bacterium]